VNPKFKITNASGRAVSPLTAVGGASVPASRAQRDEISQKRLVSSLAPPDGDGAQGTARPTFSLRAFTLVEILVVVVLMSLIVLALMAVFNSTQAAFRASLTQTDVLEGGRAAMGMVKSDLESMTPSFGVSNGSVNFYANPNPFQYQSQSASLVQSLAGSGQQRANVLENFFILTRQNTTWTGVGYVVDTANTNSINPLYRFSMTTNVLAAAGPAALYKAFTNAVFLAAWTNTSIMSHLMDGVVHLTVRAYDPNGYWMTNTYNFAGGQTTTSRNVWFFTPVLGEVGFYMFSNTVPASVEIQLGVLEDRTLQRAQSIPVANVRSNYLAGRAGQVHLFRQRFPIRNVDPAAYQQ
jgi:type II secretory pathway component PulJ